MQNRNGLSSAPNESRPNWYCLQMQPFLIDPMSIPGHLEQLHRHCQEVGNALILIQLRRWKFVATNRSSTVLARRCFARTLWYPIRLCRNL